MKYLLVLTCLFFAFLLSSCLTIEEKITFNKDGSGTYSTTIDMSKFLSDPFMKGAMMEEMKKNGQETPMRLDSVIDIYGQMAPYNPQWTAEDHRLMKTVSSRMLLDFEKEEGGVYLNYPFKDAAELTYLNTLMASANKGEDGSEDSNLSSPGNILGSAKNKFTFSKKRWTRDYSIPEMENILGEGEEAEMAKMMFEEASFVFLMEFPKKIKKVKGFSGHTITDNNTVRIEIPFLKVLEDTEAMDAYLDGKVKY